MRIYMMPEFGDALFWDGSACVGGCQFLDIKGNRISLDNIECLCDWYEEWYADMLKTSRQKTNEQWMVWWSRGLKIAQQIKTILPEDIDFYYFTLKEEVWELKPEDSFDGGIFDIGEPMLL